jgi:hypothetical protein
MARARIKLGRDFSFSERTYAFLAGDALELDEVDGYDVTRRRVLLDEVLLITRHRTRRFGVLLFGAIMCLFFAWPMAIVPRNSGAGVVFALLASPFALIVLIHGLFGTDYVTVFGRRSRARIAFNFRKGRGQEIFALLAREIQDAQDARRPVLAAAPASAPSAPSAPPPEDIPGGAGGLAS